MRETLGDRRPETLAAINKLGVLGGNPKPEGGLPAANGTRAELQCIKREIDIYANDT